MLGKAAESWKSHRPIRAWQIEVAVTEISANQGFDDWIFMLPNYSFYYKPNTRSQFQALGSWLHSSNIEIRNFTAQKNQSCHSKMMKRVFER
jgi:hypothetical protein